MNGNNDKNQHGFCPLISAAIAFQGMAPAPSGLVAPTAQVGSMVIGAPCYGPKCQWWDEDGSHCSIRFLWAVAALGEAFGDIQLGIHRLVELVEASNKQAEAEYAIRREMIENGKHIQEALLAQAQSAEFRDSVDINLPKPDKSS